MRHGIEKKYNEWLYLSYKEDGAEYQIKRLKKYIKELPECFGDLTDLTDAETKVAFQHGVNQFTVEPAGMFSFKRGQHPHGIIADDILRDPQVKLDISQLKKLRDIFVEQVEPMPTEELHVFGTAQDPADLFYELEQMPDYKCVEDPAIKDIPNQIVLWKEAFPYEKLMIYKKRMGEKSFNKEFQCRAARSEDSYFKEEKLDELTWHRLKNFNIHRPVRLNEWAYAGFDIGKKTHPSHLFVVGVDRKKRLVQLHSGWLDGWDYKDQLVYLSRAIKHFRIAKMIYDDTRAEFEYLKEAGTLPEEMEGISFTAKNKYSMATEVDSMITEKSIRFLFDPRQKRQFLTVDNDLKAVQTNEGHGDCFFSLLLAVRAYKEGQGLGVFTI